MSKMNLKTMKKTTKSNLITYAMVIVIFAVVQILVATGSMSSLMQGLWYHFVLILSLQSD